MIKRLLDLFVKVEKPMLGRWKVKTCEDYQNRDHCGDVICKTPKKASEYKDTRGK
jgi:hypothetical protein